MTKRIHAPTETLPGKDMVLTGHREGQIAGGNHSVSGSSSAATFTTIEYYAPFTFTGQIDQVTVDLSGEVTCYESGQ